jgi:hypothetical protein
MKKFTYTITLVVLFSMLWLPSEHVYASPASSNQSSTLTFDNSNSEMGCFVNALMPYQIQRNTTDYEQTMILSVGSSDMGKSPTQFTITFNFDQGTITGVLNGSYLREEEGEAYDSSEISANISNGTVTWDAAQGVWIFGGDVEMEVYLDMRNKLGSDGEEIFYGDANVKTNVTGSVTGASGQHKQLDHHGDLQTYGAFLNFFYEGDYPPATGNAEISSLSVECWLEMPFGEDMASKFPPNPGTSLPEADLGEDEKVGQDETVGRTQDNFILTDLSNQLGLFIATYGTEKEMLNQWEGWNSLNDTQKINLQNLIERLDTILALETPVSSMGLALLEASLEDQKRQEIIAQQAADLVEEELDVRKDVRDAVWSETLRYTLGDTAVSIYDSYQIFKDVKSVYDAGAGWINNIKDPDTAATEKIKKDSLSTAGANKTPVDIAIDAIGYINTIATYPSVFHYAYYREIYDQLVNAQDKNKKKTPAEAHQDAMEALRKRVKDYAAGQFGDESNRLEQQAWGPGTLHALKPGGIYDKAFRALVDKNVAPPKVSL